VGCYQTNCPGGANDFFKFIQNCVCGSGPCASACSSANDYCQTLGCNPNTGCSTGCTNCLNQYVATGKQCDPAGSPVGTCCNADTNCAQYLSGTNANCL
jgi:hypothetical protein